MVLLLLIEGARAGAVFAGGAFFADSQDDEASDGEDQAGDNEGSHIFPPIIRLVLGPFGQ